MNACYANLHLDMTRYKSAAGSQAWHTWEGAEERENPCLPKSVTGLKARSHSCLSHERTMHGWDLAKHFVIALLFRPKAAAARR